jgi:hypothetical protein
MNNWLKISEFEKITGLKNRTIMSAIKRNAIPDSCISRSNTNSNEVDIPVLFCDIEVLDRNFADKKTTKPIYINAQEAAVFWYNNLAINRQSSKELKEKLEQYIFTFNPNFMVKNRGKPPNLKDAEVYDIDDMSYHEALRLEKVAKAKIADLEFNEKNGTLVKKSIVYDELFSFGKELKSGFTSIPSRIIDQILASNNDRTKIFNILSDAITNELERLSGIANLLK